MDETTKARADYWLNRYAPKCVLGYEVMECCGTQAIHTDVPIGMSISVDKVPIDKLDHSYIRITSEERVGVDFVVKEGTHELGDGNHLNFRYVERVSRGGGRLYQSHEVGIYGCAATQPELFRTTYAAGVSDYILGGRLYRASFSDVDIPFPREEGITYVREYLKGYYVIAIKPTFNPATFFEIFKDNIVFEGPKFYNLNHTREDNDLQLILFKF